MATEYGAAAVLDFLLHAGERGLLPAATASALAVGCRTVFEILDDGEAADLRAVDLNTLVNRFSNRRARDFNPSSLKEYGRRVHRAWELFSAWKADPANFSPKGRTTSAKISREPKKADRRSISDPMTNSFPAAVTVNAIANESPDFFTSTFPIRRGHLVTIANLPADLTVDEAERLASFVRLLGASD